MMIGHTAPVVIQAFIFIAIISVDPVTLVTLLAAAVLGAWLGAGCGRAAAAATAFRSGWGSPCSSRP